MTIARRLVSAAGISPGIALFAMLLAGGGSALAADEVITITLAGDVGFNSSREAVRPDGARKLGRLIPFEETTSLIEDEITGDLNFLNVETVVTDRNDLPIDTKGQGAGFNFRTHPNAMRHLARSGFNLFSLANNHSMDYGPEGLAETLKHMPALVPEGLFAYGGIGANREEASRPTAFDLKGAKLAFASIGIVTSNLERHRAGERKPGQIAYRFDEDWKLILKRLAETPADYRILSIHYGTEGEVRTDARQIQEFRREAAVGAGIDLVVGHHAHVVRGVEIVGKSVVFYGLGNFLHFGTANMNGKGLCKSYGLLARVHLLKREGEIRVRAIEAIPVTDTHVRPARLPVAEAVKRIHALNYLGSLLDDSASGAKGVRFAPQANGTGLFCLEGAGSDPGRIGLLCKGWKPAGAIPASLGNSIRAACAK